MKEIRGRPSCWRISSKRWRVIRTARFMKERCRCLCNISALRSIGVLHLQNIDANSIEAEQCNVDGEGNSSCAPVSLAHSPSPNTLPKLAMIIGICVAALIIGAKHRLLESAEFCMFLSSVQAEPRSRSSACVGAGALAA